MAVYFSLDFLNFGAVLFDPFLFFFPFCSHFESYDTFVDFRLEGFGGLLCAIYYGFDSSGRLYPMFQFLG